MTTSSPSHENVPLPAPARRRRFPRVLSATLIAVGLAALKLKGFLILFIEKVRLFLVNPFEGFGALQYAIAGGSMAVTIAAYAIKFPLGLVIGFVVITFIHETGHALVIRMKGLRAGYLVFIPFIGGAVTLKNQPRTAYDDALIGLAGPVAGTLASLVSLQIYKWTDNPLYLWVAFVGFFLNLFNLLPIGMLDGGRISAAVTKWMWVFGGGFLLYHVIKRPNPFMIVVLVLAVIQVWASIQREKDDKAFYDVTLGQRAFIAVAYFALVGFLGHQFYMALKRLTLLEG